VLLWDSWVRSVKHNFNIVGIDMLAQNRENVEFLVKIYPKGTFPLSDFYKILHGEAVTRPHPSAKFNRCGFKNVGLQPPTSPKLVFLV